MSYLKTADNTELYYEVHGKGHSILFLGGILGGPNLWKAYQAPFFLERFQCIFLCYRGQRPTRTKGAFDFEDLLRDALALLKHLGVQKTHIVGDAFGGSVALHLAHRYPDRITSLVLSGTAAPISDRRLGLKIKSWNEVLRKTDLQTFFHVILPDLFSSQFLKAESARFDEIAEKWTNSHDREDLLLLLGALSTMSRLPNSLSIKMPIAITNLLNDDIVRPHHAEALAKSFDGALSWELECGHAVCEEKPQEYIRQIEAFLLERAASPTIQPPFTEPKKNKYSRHL